MQDVVFFTATLKDGTEIRVNARNISVYYADGNVGTVIRTTNGDEYCIREYPMAIDNFLNRLIK